MIARRMLFFVFAFVLSSSAFAADPIKLHAGRLEMVFEPDTALLRYVRIGEHQILQGISAPVRDRFWGTVPPQVSNVRVEQKEDSFSLGFDVTCRQREIDFVWKGNLSGTKEGKITFTFDGIANSEFLRNRIGFCVLHGAEAAGKPCVVETVSGEMVKGKFPDYISPHQPFKDIRAISHELTPGVWAKVRMEGDTFEMEDQRNWTDASFKTYCTPLAIPYPVKVEKGTKISHRIELSVDGGEKVAIGAKREPGVIVKVTDRKQPLPGIGLRISSQTEQLSKQEVARLRALHLKHLRVDLTPSDKNAGALLRRAAQQASPLDVQLIVGLHLGENADQELQSLGAVLAEISQPSTWLLISADDRKVQATRAFLNRAGQRGRLGRGEDTNFTELNRNRPDPKGIEAVSYGMNPQIHAFDNTSIVETLAIQGDTVRSARQFVGELPLLISPITLRKQAADLAPAAGELPATVDRRQPSNFAAGWTIGSIKYLAEAGVDSLTYFETVGWLGVMESAAGSSLPDQFPSQPSQLFPIYYVLQQVGELAGGQVRETTSTEPMSIVGLAVEKDRERRLLLANLTPIKQATRVQGYAAPVEVLRLDDSHPKLTAAPEGVKTSDRGELLIDLPPYGIAVLVVR